MQYSVSPDGEKFKLPDEKDYKKEYDRLVEQVNRQKKEGKETSYSPMPDSVILEHPLLGKRNFHFSL